MKSTRGWVGLVEKGALKPSKVIIPLGWQRMEARALAVGTQKQRHVELVTFMKELNLNRVRPGQ